MIIAGILQIIYYFILLVSAPLRLLPDATLSASATTAISTAGTYLKSFDFIFPLTTFITILLLILGIETGILAYKFIMWIIKKIPGIS